MEIYAFEPVYSVLTCSIARQLLKLCLQGESCLDYTWETPWRPRPVLTFCCEGGVVKMYHSGRLVAQLDADVVAKVAEGREDVIYEVVAGTARPIMVRGDRFVKLRLLRDDAPPTLEINGVHMHRIEEVDPWTDARLKVRAARVRKGCKVLDVCTGLGYTAIASLLAGAEFVLTIEIDELVLWAAERNPWSWYLISRNVVLVWGDALDVVPRLRDEAFDRVIHDPPRFSLAGELYSKEFYAELYRVLRPGGLLYHYTGLPGKHSKLSVVRGVMNRLREVGFTDVRFDENSLGVIARKPR